MRLKSIILAQNKEQLLSLKEVQDESVIKRLNLTFNKKIKSE